LGDAQAGVRHVRAVVEWQEKLVDDMRLRKHPDVTVAQHALTLLRRSLHWSEAQAKQAQAEFDLLRGPGNRAVHAGQWRV
jgi:hypothetical protein